MRSFIAILAIVSSLSAAATIALADPAVKEADDCAGRFSLAPAHAVTRVLDAETIALDDGSEVRLVGTLAPRRPLKSPSDESWPPEQQALLALTQLVLGQSVEIGTAGRQTDRYGRRLAHVFVRGPGGRSWVQGELLLLGQARVYAIPQSVACIDEMLALERKAREAELGLWGNAVYAIRTALRTRELMGLRSTFQIVEGRVADIAEVRGKIYLNFGSDWRHDFTAGILSRRKGSGPEVRGFDALALKGKKVRVRGWIERRNGPFIEIVHPGQIEILDGIGAPATPAPATVGADRSPNEKRPALPPGALDL